MGLFGQTNTESTPPAVTYVRVQPFEMKTAEWTIQAIVIYVLIRDFLMYVVPWLVGGLYKWVHATFPKAEQLIAEELEEVLETVSDKVGAAMDTAGAAAEGPLKHAEEELLEAATKGGVGLMSRLVDELVS
jgi:hypothetical protein